MSVSVCRRIAQLLRLLQPCLLRLGGERFGDPLLVGVDGVAGTVLTGVGVLVSVANGLRIALCSTVCELGVKADRVGQQAGLH